jgi:CRP/FNR family transcriptional regulator, cyclic AMP receptor protein
MAQSHTSRLPQSLECISLFSRLPAETLARLPKLCSWRRYEPGEPIVDHLDASDDVFFITQGEVRASLYSLDGKAVTFTDLGAGEMFGELAAIDGRPRSASIEARTSCVVASMSAATFREVLGSNPVVAFAVLQHLVAKIRTLTTRVYEFSALAASNRVQAEILRLAMLAPREGNGARIGDAPTHAEIASRVSSHREAVTREFNRLSRLGVVERRGRVLFVKNIEHLARMVREVTGE